MDLYVFLHTTAKYYKVKPLSNARTGPLLHTQEGFCEGILFQVEQYVIHKHYTYHRPYITYIEFSSE